MADAKPVTIVKPADPALGLFRGFRTADWPGRWSMTRQLGLRLLIVAAMLFSFWNARASEPRWVIGPPFFTGPSGNAVVWYTPTPRYFTDPGDLSGSVNHAAADAMVSAAASVWNVPTSRMEIAQGGTLAEHVSGANSYLSSTGPIFPSDVQSANYAAIQIAVIYDKDGSVTDMLLGGGASDPAECRQNGVTEDVDSIVPAGQIQHAVLVLNGRCTGSAPEKQLQMQYQLERAFGRVLGVGWSQTNDNVFTQTPMPNYQQELHWPIMHPIDIVCGAYTYQCLPLPFTLRDDDIAAITSLYEIGEAGWGNQWGAAIPAGKIASFTNATRTFGTMTFPSGQGMAGVNVTARRMPLFQNFVESWQTTSAVTGLFFQQQGGSPALGAPIGMNESMGSPGSGWEGYYDLAWVPAVYPGDYALGLQIGMEPINPLYTGSHAVGPYGSGQVEPSGSPVVSVDYNGPNLNGWDDEVSHTITDAAGTCNTGGDGTEAAPAGVPAGGWWTGLLCAHGHSAWSSVTAKAGRTATLEVTALDENGLATTAKAMPVMGLWAANDPIGTLPTQGSTPSAFNTITLGQTGLGLATGTAAASLRFAVSDARGAGRPDFAYRARLLYADSVQPAVVAGGGSSFTITGMGFRLGNEVLVNGAVAAVQSWTATTIVVVAPAVSAMVSRPTGAVDVQVVDLSTHGTSVMSAALTYTNVAPDVLTVVSAPSGSVAVGTAVTFAVRVTMPDGVTPVAGLPVAFTFGPGSVQFAGCAAMPCVVVTDATGLASTTVTPMAYGPVTLQAAALGLSGSATFNAVSRSIAIMRASEYVAEGAVVAWSPQVSTVENGAPATGLAVAWSVGTGISISSSSTATDALGAASNPASVGPLAAGVQATGQACAWTTVCVNFSATGVAQSAFRLAVMSGAGQAIALGAAFAPVVFEVTDDTGHPVAGASVAFHQTMDAAQMACPARGRCPVAPVVGAADSVAVSDVDGLVTVAPLQLASTGGVTNLAAVSGTQGFVSLSIRQGP